MNDNSFQVENDAQNSQNDFHSSQVNLLGKPKTLYEASIDESGKAKLYFMVIFSSLIILLALFSILYLVIQGQTNAYIYDLMQGFQFQYDYQMTSTPLMTTTPSISLNSN